MPWNLRLGAVYGPDRRPCPLWPLVELFSEDVENKIAELLAPQPRLPTPQYFAQLNFAPRLNGCIRRGGRWIYVGDNRPPSSQWWDAVHRFLNVGLYLGKRANFVDWDNKGS